MAIPCGAMSPIGVGIGVIELEGEETATQKIDKLTVSRWPEELTPAEREMIYGTYREKQKGPAAPPWNCSLIGNE